MRCGTSVSLMAQTGQSEAIHSPEEWASTVVRLTVPVFWLRSARHGRTSAARLAAIPAGESPANRRSPDTVVVISSDGKGDRPAESLEVKAPVGRETGQIRTGGPAT